MLKVAITGGIGSGKTLIVSLFKTLGIPVYDADAAAKRLMDESPVIKEQLTRYFGTEVYKDGLLDRRFLASKIFNNEDSLKKVNAIVHPVTIQDSKNWFAHQQSPYAIKEAAILFESGSDRFVDFIIGVSANEELRIKRTMERSDLSREQVVERMRRQMPEDEKMSRCNVVIDNNGNTSLINQVLNIHEKLLRATGT